eukprot:scaffold7375_cov268-Pinguiococcus_pyrenoidosus.AAC.52
MHSVVALFAHSTRGLSASMRPTRAPARRPLALQVVYIRRTSRRNRPVNATAGRASLARKKALYSVGLACQRGTFTIPLGSARPLVPRHLYGHFRTDDFRLERLERFVQQRIAIDQRIVWKVGVRLSTACHDPRGPQAQSETGRTATALLQRAKSERTRIQSQSRGKLGICLAVLLVELCYE